MTSRECYRFWVLEWVDVMTLSVRYSALHDDCEPLAIGALGVQIVVKDG